MQEFPHEYPYESSDGYHSAENVQEIVTAMCQTYAVSESICRVNRVRRNGDTPMHLIHRYVRALRLHLLLGDKATILSILETDDYLTQRACGKVLLEKLGLVLYRLHSLPSFQGLFYSLSC